MKINKTTVADIDKVIWDSKVPYWLSLIPWLEFDKHGRAKFVTLDGITESVIETAILNIDSSPSFRKAAVKYCRDNEITMIEGRSVDEWMKEKKFPKAKNYKENMVNLTIDGKSVDMKLTRFLSGINEVWEKSLPTYTQLKAKGRKLRVKGLNFENPLVRDIAEDKKYYEVGNYFTAFDSFLSAYTGTDVILSLNPLDKLTVSGGEECGINPTSFSSCWSTYIEKADEDVKVEVQGYYSNPEGQIAISKSKLSGLIFIPNGREVNVPGTDFSFYGYKERAHVWLDQGGVFIEYIYPGCTEGRRNEFYTALETKEIPVIRPGQHGAGRTVPFKNNMEKEVYDNYIKECSGRKRLSLDKVEFNGNVLSMRTY